MGGPAAGRALWIATGNKKKLVELERLLRPLGLTLRSLADLPRAITIVEDAPTFAGNAAIKARALVGALSPGDLSLGDDSGLCVDALDGRPGVLSARYGGPGLTDAERVQKLLGELAGVPAAQRTARFVCSLALADAKGEIVAAIEDTCEGRIANAPGGAGGFGYDPVFVPDAAAGQTMAELGAAAKDAISHRGRALLQLAEFLRSRSAG